MTRRTALWLASIALLAGFAGMVLSAWHPFGLSAHAAGSAEAFFVFIGVMAFLHGHVEGGRAANRHSDDTIEDLEWKVVRLRKLLSTAHIQVSEAVRAADMASHDAAFAELVSTLNRGPLSLAARDRVLVFDEVSS